MVRDVRSAAFILPVLLLAASTSLSCGDTEVDGFLDRARDAATSLEETVKDAVGAVAGLSPDGPDSRDGTVQRPPRPGGSIMAGPAVNILSEVIDGNGATLTVVKEGDPLDGLSLTVPSGAYPDSLQVNISRAPVINHTFGDYFNPVTPFIVVENGGAYSAEPMTLRIPVDIPDGHFAMAFYYDDSLGALEGIPFTSLEPDSITVATRHFSRLVVSVIGYSALDALIKGDIDSHFRPGIDDWQFVNRGSYISPEGHCAGQSVVAMWYFCEQPDGKDLTLHGRYDRNGDRPATPDLWADDSNAYRLCSVVQADIDWEDFGIKFQREFRGKDDLNQFRAFAYAIKLTGEPQYVGITSNAGGGHAMIVYRVFNNSLYISDPNYPGATDRRIEVVGGAFTPYHSGANGDAIAAGQGKAYERIGYQAKSAMVDWSLLTQRWQELKDGTIGDWEFPAYGIVVRDDDGNETPVVDGYKSESKKIKIGLDCDFTAGFKLYRDGVRVSPDADNKYELLDGSNRFGMHIVGDLNSDPQNRRWQYVDFKYFEIGYESADCSGWVLDSVVSHVDEIQQEGHRWEVTEGSYLYDGRLVLTSEAGESELHYTLTGGWSPLPTCLKSGEARTVMLNAAVVTEIIPPLDSWGTVSNYLVVTVDGSTLGSVDIDATADHNPGMSSRRIELNFGEGAPGDYHEVTVSFSAASYGEYRYRYVWNG